MIVKTIVFRADRKPNPSFVHIGFETDNMVERLVFVLPSIHVQQTATLMIDGKYVNMAMLAEESGRYYIDLTAELVGAPGQIDAYITIDAPDGKVWNSAPFALVTGDLPNVDGAIQEYFPDAIQQMRQEIAGHRAEMQDQSKAVQAAADRAEKAAGDISDTLDGGTDGQFLGNVNGKPTWLTLGAGSGGGSGPGESGLPGKDGGYYVPNVNDDGNLSWTPSEPDMPGVPAVNIKGRDGSDANVTAENVTKALGYTPADNEDVERLSEEIVELDDSLFSTGYSEDKADVPKDLAVVIEGTMVNVWGYTQAIAAIDLVKYPVSAGQKYYITNVYRASAALYAFEKADGTVFGAYPTADTASKVTATDYEIVVPDEAIYLLINDVSRWQSYPYTLQTLAQSEEKTFRAKALLPNYVPSRLYGKKLVACGDSITDGSNPAGGYFKNYAELVAERHRMVYHKDAIGGSTMTNVEGKNPFCVSRYLNHTDFDYLTIWFGWNDGAYATLGTIEDTEDTTFYGAYKKVLTHYMTNYPTKKIGIVVPYGFRTNIQQAVREISEMFGVPCLDLADGKRCSLIWGEDNDAQLARRAALTYDTTHPNQAGHEFIATMYEQFLLRL